MIAAKLRAIPELSEAEAGDFRGAGASGVELRRVRDRDGEEVLIIAAVAGVRAVLGVADGRPTRIVLPGLAIPAVCAGALEVVIGALVDLIADLEEGEAGPEGQPAAEWEL